MKQQSNTEKKIISSGYVIPSEKVSEILERFGFNEIREGYWRHEKGNDSMSTVDAFDVLCGNVLTDAFFKTNYVTKTQPCGDLHTLFHDLWKRSVGAPDYDRNLWEELKGKFLISTTQNNQP